ncbi:type IV pilus assembly protein PilV [Pelomonas saccharophila]|uniref:Type IV pilus assembly protein PilV n=1 Tax=Roseateles saccharophilus TaxID=304 RepID=A0ABU1YJJ0_ROSSA|nr:prepilin-type N-terminal cleavage/methylation domain-containing protein [Roseateles saccharophilus]MDR7269014.1 type IV pilus assembly protein PilV [Roseateles saccharophilus]
MLNHRRSQSGVLLLEVLIALLIFSLGVLGLVGLQANAIKQSGQSKYRIDATLLANELIGQMWVADRNYTTLNAAFTSTSGGGPSYRAWKTKVLAALPGADTYPPTVILTQVNPLNAIVGNTTVAPVGLTPSTRVTITMQWKAPGEPSGDPAHSFVLTNEIK